MKRKLMLAFLGGVVSTVGILAVMLTAALQEAEADAPAAEAVIDPDFYSPTIAARDVYYPGTEELAPDEMRVIACGTGMPNQRLKQAAACWLVELGNGEKFLFDIGTGSAERIVNGEPEIGAQVDELPEEVTTFEEDGVTYYQFDTVFFEAVEDESSGVFYEVVGSPDDSEEVELKGA